MVDNHIITEKTPPADTENAAPAAADGLPPGTDHTKAQDDAADGVLGGARFAAKAAAAQRRLLDTRSSGREAQREDGASFLSADWRPPPDEGGGERTRYAWRVAEIADELSGWTARIRRRRFRSFLPAALMLCLFVGYYQIFLPRFDGTDQDVTAAFESLQAHLPVKAGDNLMLTEAAVRSSEVFLHLVITEASLSGLDDTGRRRVADESAALASGLCRQETFGRAVAQGFTLRVRITAGDSAVSAEALVRSCPSEPESAVRQDSAAGQDASESRQSD